MKHNYILIVLLLLASVNQVNCQSTIPNGDFENWQNVGSATEEPTSWNGYKTGTGILNGGPQTCFRESTLPHSGVYCLKLENGSFFGTTVNATATTGQIHTPSTNLLDRYISTVTGLSDFNSPFTGRPDSLVGWFRFTQGGTDIGQVSAYLHDNYDYEEPDQGASASHLIASAVYNVPNGNTSNWTRFSVPFSYVAGSMGDTTPTHILLIATASTSLVNSNSNTIFWVDDLEVIYCTPTTSGILENNFGNDLVIYPNPTSGNFSIDLGDIYENSQISIIDITGKLIDSKIMTQSQILNLSIEEPNGIYIVSVQAGDKKAVIRLIKQ